MFDDDIFAHKNEWVYVNNKLLSNVSKTTEDIVVDLSDKLPNDGATYDVLFSATVTPANEKDKFCFIYPSNDEISSMKVVQSRTAVVGIDARACGAFLLPITSSRSISLGANTSTNSKGTINFYMHAYKKIG